MVNERDIVEDMHAESYTEGSKVVRRAVALTLF